MDLGFIGTLKMMFNPESKAVKHEIKSAKFIDIL